MFEKFLSQYSRDASSQPPAIQSKFEIKAILKDIYDFNHTSFSNGLFRVIDFNKIEYWKEIISKVFDIDHLQITPFGYDWLGRIFAIESNNNTPTGQIFLFVPYSSDSFKIPSSLIDFFDQILITEREAAVEATLFSKFIHSNKINNIPIDKCASLNKPTFLGGDLTIGNMALCDIEVYWDIFGQVLDQILAKRPL